MITKLRRIPGQLLGLVKSLIRDPFHMTTRFFQAYWHARELTLIQNNVHEIDKKDILLFATLRNEAIRIPYFLDYYRNLGVRHFLIVDNGSTDDFMELVADMPDVSVWHTNASYKASNFGMHWLNHLLRRYGCNHWCVTCDPDEFLIYPYHAHRNLHELADFLESEERRSLCCLMLDMYSDKPLKDAHYHPGDNPIEVAPYFDASGYIQHQGWHRENYTVGGVRRRVFFRDNPEESPALNKTPFVKWRWSYSYFLSMHHLVPSWLNQAHSGDRNSPTGCLMHFKYFSLLENKVEEEMGRGEHWNDSMEYRRYYQKMDRESVSMMFDGSVKYKDWHQLVDKGLMNIGQWF